MFLHQVDLGRGEESTVLCPVHVLGRRVVEVFSGTYQDGQEDPMSGACHTSSDGGQLGLQSVEVDKGDAECWHLNIALCGQPPDVVRQLW